MITGVASKKGFALATVLIASVVMMIVLLSAVAATASVKSAILSQQYERMAQLAGEAGAAYAQACVQYAESAGIPASSLWSSAKPLKPNTDCSGNELIACPTVAASVRCAVVIDGNARSSFSIGAPTLDADGNVLTIPQSGYVDILRSSNGAVWRTYKQPTVQPLVSSNLCGGATTNTLGWTQAILHTTATKILTGNAAQPITSNNGSAYAGPQYYRKDFTVTEAGTYRFDVAASDQSRVFIDGALLTTTWSSSLSATREYTLSTGCHTIYIQNYNNTIVNDPTTVELSITKAGSSVPLVKTDNTWRVSRGELKHFSQVGYYQSSSVWTSAKDQGPVGTSPWTSTPTNWPDTNARWISTVHSYSSGYPASAYAYFIPSSPAALTMTSTDDYRISVACDNNCRVFVDGNETIVCNAAWNVTCDTTVSLTGGKHQMGVELFNSGTSANDAGFIFAVTQRSTGRVILHSDDTWTASNAWYDAKQLVYSYDEQYTPSPRIAGSATARALVVGGGGGGARAGSGGGAGGYVYDSNISLTTGVYWVTVGAGGSGGNTGSGGAVSNGKRGLNSSFFTLVAEGGGAGTSHQTGYGQPGGSGGGGSIVNTDISRIGGFGSQGNLGGAGFFEASWLGAGGGGGGAGAAGGAGGSTSGSGSGGTGLVSNISGANVTYAGGGASGEISGAYVGTAGAGGGGGATVNGVGGNGVANRGGGGGGGSANGTTYYNGGNGGSGIVIISYPTGSLYAVGGSITTSGGYTIHTFTTSSNLLVYYL